MKQKLTFLTVLFAALSAFSAEYYVDASRPDDTGVATNWATAKKTIQAAVDLTTDGDTVWVTNGTYVLSAEISVTNAITIHSVNGPAVTIVDGGGSNRCFNLHDNECVIEGFTITRGGAWDGSGGGVCCGGITPVVSNCVFFANETVEIYISGLFGGGMFNGTSINCVFDSNGANYGGGKFGGRAYRCVFTNNYGISSGGLLFSAGHGAGMYMGEAYDCLFVGNKESPLGAGMYGATAYNCTFVNNWSWPPGGTLADSTAYNCVFKGNDLYGSFEILDSTVYNSCSVELVGGINGNITNAPLFVDAANGDFRLQSNSPCINWGCNAYVTNATDLAGNPRIVEGAVDMGAYEYQGTVGLVDSDSDGISDDWERQHGGNQSPERVCSNGVNSILQAYIAGLDPNDPESRFAVSVSGQTLRWNATSGRVYAVYYSTNLLNGFEPLGTNILWTADGFADSSPNAEQRFYRVEVRKP